MKVLYACCFKCNETIEYITHGDDTTFPRGEWLAHQDHIVTGFKTSAEANACLDGDPYGMRAKAEAGR